MNETFKPHNMTLEKCIERVKQAIKNSGIADFKQIYTSRDQEVRDIIEQLRIANMPEGFEKWQLPVFFDKGAVLWITTATPYKKIRNCSHVSPGFRFLGSGSIIYDGIELTMGDWMFIPANISYGFDVGEFGVTMLYCYEGCCA